MANVKKILPENVKGEFFVDSTCIDCDACRQLAPEVFASSGSYSYVHSQPKDEITRKKAIYALISCPVGAIGAKDKLNVPEIIDDFPIPIEDEVFYCGFNSDKSFGANSYFVKSPAGNWLIDSPRFSSHLLKKFKRSGGIKYIFLSHRDDVADAESFAIHFGAKIIIHKRDSIAVRRAEILIDGDSPVEVEANFVVIPTPGHTAGHCVLLYRDKFLFAGDHIWWDRETKSLYASKSVCWYSWEKQIESIEKLLNFEFEWVLPGHGQMVKLSKDEMKKKLLLLVKKIGQAK